MKEQGMSIESTVDKSGFQIYAYLVSYVLSTSTNMQLSSYKPAVMPTVPAMTNVNMSYIYILILNIVVIY